MIKTIKLLLTIVLITGLTGCSGYSFRSVDNPFKDHEIKTIAVPMFVNKTSLGDVTPVYTRRIVDMLSSYTGLKVRAGSFTNEDAVLIGIITPFYKRASKEVHFSSSSLMSESKRGEIGNRRAFILPTVGLFEVNVTIHILKNPTQAEVDFFSENFEFTKGSFPRTVLSNSFRMAGSFSVGNGVGDVDSEAAVQGTANRGALRKALVTTGDNLVNSFREVLANAF